MDAFPGGHVRASVAILLILLCAVITPLHSMPQWRPLDGRVNSPVAIRRLNGGDAFRDAGGIHGSCAEEFCRSAGGSPERSPADPGLRGFWGMCTCRCPKIAPTFREDLHKCANNINECALSDFVSSVGDENQPPSSQKIPLVFLPLRGQILHPSAAIRIDGMSLEQMAGHDTSKCTVIGAHFLTRHGWVHLSNSTTDIMDNLGSYLGITQKGRDGSLLYRESSTPFGIYEENHKTYLKWLGELNMRELLGGRMVLVHLSCQINDLEEPILQCVGFRVAGTISLTQGIREMTFDGQETTGPDFVAGSDSNNNAASENNGQPSGLTPSEWIAIATASLFLGAIYVASVFLYLNLKKSGKNNNLEDKENNSNLGTQSGCMGGRLWRKMSSGSGEGNTSSAPDGIVKTNPLLILHQCHQHHKRQSSFYTQGSGKNGGSNTEVKASSDDSNDEESHHQPPGSSSPMMLKPMLNLEGLSSDEESANKTTGQRDSHHLSQSRHRVTAALVHSSAPSSSPIERLPEEDVSIVEAPSPPSVMSPVPMELSLNMRTEPPDSFPPDITSDDPFVPSLFSSSPEALLAAMMGMNGSAMGDNHGQSRRKLYFNPAYFDPELLQAPPPAALEFLSKIREVIALARQRMAAKRFSPSLLGIPEVEEEETNIMTDSNAKAEDSAPVSILPNLKRENSRHLSKPRDKAIQKWLENLNSASKKSTDTLPIQVGPEVTISPPPPLKKKARAPPIPSSFAEDTKTVASDTKKAMNAVIRELEVRRGVGAMCKWDAKNENGFYEVDSLEKPKKAEVGDSMEVVATRNKATEAKLVDETSSVKLYRLPELLSRVDGYSLVSEVYVNDSYNTIGSVSGDTTEKIRREPEGNGAVQDECIREVVNMKPEAYKEGRVVKEMNDEDKKMTEEAGEEMEIKEILTITLKDSPSNHRRSMLEEETFEMDTLDRKKSDESAEDDSAGSISAFSDECNYMDSLERPLHRISLHSSGSFRSDTMGKACNTKSNNNSATDLASVLASSPLTRAYGSLREVYEARQRRRREQRRRRSSDIAAGAAYGPIRHHNLSANPAWRLVRRLPEDDPNYYLYKPHCYSPLSGQSKESPLHLLLLPQGNSKNEQIKQKPSTPSSLLKNQFEVRKSPKPQQPEIKNQAKYSPPKHSRQQFSNSQHIPRIEPSAHVGYFKQEGLYTSPFCDDDDDDEEDNDSADDDIELTNCSVAPHDSSPNKENTFSPPKLNAPLSNENMSMFSFWQHLQNQNRLMQQTSSTGNRKERKMQKSLASKGMRIALELQRELNRAQQKNPAANITKKPGGFIGKGGESENGKVSKRTWRRLIEKREKERVAEEESSRETRAGGIERLEGEVRRAVGSGGMVGKLNQKKELKFRVEDSGYLSSSDESALGRVNLRKGGHCNLIGAAMDDEEESKKGDGDVASDSEGESVFDGASESGAESIATDSFFGSFRVFSTAAQRAEQLQKQHQRCSALFEMISEGSLNGSDRIKVHHASEEDATDSESGGFSRVNGSPKRNFFTKANS